MDNTTHAEGQEIKSLSPILPESSPGPTREDVQEITRSDGKKYTIRNYRSVYFMPDMWKAFYNSLRVSSKARITAQVLIQTGCRINEARHIREDDLDYDRCTIRFRVTKTKAVKGEKTGKPRTIPISSAFMKELKKHFRGKEQGKLIGLNSTASFNITLKKKLKDLGVKNYYMFSAHNIRKTHGNWLKTLGNAGLIRCDSSEICLRLGHDYETFLKDYGSPGEFNHKDILEAKEILGDLYAR